MTLLICNPSYNEFRTMLWKDSVIHNFLPVISCQALTDYKYYSCIFLLSNIFVKKSYLKRFASYVCENSWHVFGLLKLRWDIEKVWRDLRVCMLEWFSARPQFANLITLVRACAWIEHLWPVSGSVSGSVSVHCSMHSHVFERSNDRGLSVWGLPPHESWAAGWKSSLTLFLCLSFPLSAALPLSFSLCQAGRTQTEVLPSWGTNPHFLWNFQRRFFPVQIPQPLNFPGWNSENNSVERNMEEWVEVGRWGTGWDGGGRGAVGAALPPFLLPPSVSSPLDIIDMRSRWLPKIKIWLHTCFYCWSGFPKSAYWFLLRVRQRCPCSTSSPIPRARMI